MPKKDDPKYPLGKKDQAVWDAFITEKEVEKTIPENFEALLQEQDDRPSLEPDIKHQKPAVTIEKAATKINQQEQKQSPQLDRRTADKLQKGKIPIESVLDLHGKNQQQAYEELTYFIQKAVQKQQRCVLVITGKGKPRLSTDKIFDKEDGVLKQKVPRWLSEKIFSDHVLKIVPAKPKDGGSGALYIYLRRQR